MQIRTAVTDNFGMQVTVTYGPVLVSVIFDVDDEETIMGALRDGFRDARDMRDAGVGQNGDGHVHSG